MHDCQASVFTFVQIIGKIERLNMDSLNASFSFGIKPYPERVALLVLFYVITLSVYRLYLSPIAHFPGSKFAALTGWYEVYWDVFKGGQFINQIEKWHKRYGKCVLFLAVGFHYYPVSKSQGR